MAIKVLVVDDSPLIRGVLTEILNTAVDICVIGTAHDAYEARDKIKQLNPDVITLDIEMPKMNGISFLKNLMRLRPMPVVMVSTLTEDGAPATLEALALGAVDFIAKPKHNVAEGLVDYQYELHGKIRAAALAKIRAYSETNGKAKLSATKHSNHELFRFQENYLLAIGASTGGTEAIKEVVTQLPSHCPPVLVTQHIPKLFSASFAQRLNNESKVNVWEAKDGQKIEYGNVYIAPGDEHLTVKRMINGQFLCVLDKDVPVNRHRPSVDKLFDSIATKAKGMASGVILTGMGADGAKGLLNMKNAGCHTLAQDQVTSVIWGMPGSAVELGATKNVYPLQDIATQLLKSALKK